MFSRKSEKEKDISFGCLWNEVVFLGYNSFGEGMNSAAFEKKHTTRHAQKQSVDAGGLEKRYPIFRKQKTFQIFVEL